ncbi:MAG TPA: hypothetical protein VFT47_08720 [Vicinamibacterales bacterium]|nr:hypothetical protein [Vicinamibacterales bacterium]
MSWRHRTAAVVLFVLTALPVGRILCAVDCGFASTPQATHHASGQSCEQPAPPSSGPKVEGDAPDRCGSHDGDLTQIAATRTERGDSASSSGVFIDAIATGPITPLARISPLDYTAPPGTAPPTTLPIVLRV